MRWLPLILASLFTLIAFRALDAHETPPASPERIDQLIAQLGDESYPQRVNAEKLLVRLGEPMLPRLRKEAALNQDHEIKRRCAYVVGAILLAAKTSKSTGLELSVIKPGSFPMGLVNLRGGRTDDTHHPVKITKTFLLGCYEVTQDQYQKVMEVNPSYYSAQGEGREKVKGLPVDRFPVESLSWFDAVAFCNRLSKLDGFPLHYRIDDPVMEKNSILTAKVSVVSPLGYRLPTEAEWEYACRAGTTTTFHYGNTSTGNESNLRPGPSQAYGAAHAEPLERPTRVGSYRANGWGLYDMHGNVAEWCEDWYDKEYYKASPETDPPGPATGTHRILRGGSWLVNESNCRSASRFYQVPGEASSFAGFRVARTP